MEGVTSLVGNSLPLQLFQNVNKKTYACLQHLLRHKFDEALYPSDYPASKRAAVLVILYERNESLRVLLTTRSKSLRAHPYQTALPGGKFDSTDVDLIATALREANEEIALPLESPHLHILCYLRPFISLSKLFVTPVVAFLTELTVLDALYPSPTEVDAIFDHPLEAFLQPELAASEPLVEIGSENWPYLGEFYNATDSPSPLTTGDYRMHRFRSCCTPIKGLTADILITIAEITYNQDTAFQRRSANQIEPHVATWSLFEEYIDTQRSLQ